MYPLKSKIRNRNKIRSKVFGSTNTTISSLAGQGVGVALFELFNSQLELQMVHTQSRSFSAKVKMVCVASFQWSEPSHLLWEAPNSTATYLRNSDFQNDTHCIKCHHVTSLPAWRAPCKLPFLSWCKWKRTRPEPLSEVFGITPTPLTHWAFGPPPPLGQHCHFMRWATGRQIHLDHIKWNFLSQDSSISISLWTLVGYTWYLAGVRISSLIAYIPNLLSLPVSSCKAIRAENQFATCAHPYSGLSTSGKYCPEKKIKKERNEKRQIWEIQICSYILIPWLSKCWLVDNPQFAPYQNKYSKDAALNS